MTDQEIADLESAIALMRAAGCTKLPIRLEVIEQWIARERRRAEPRAARVHVEAAE